MIVNNTPVRTSKNYKINNIDIDVDIPSKIDEFNSLTITGDTSNFQISKDISKMPLIYGNGKELEKLIFNKVNSCIKVSDTKSGVLNLEFELNEFSREIYHPYKSLSFLLLIH